MASMPPINDRVRSRRYGQSCPSSGPNCTIYQKHLNFLVLLRPFERNLRSDTSFMSVLPGSHAWRAPWKRFGYNDTRERTCQCRRIDFLPNPSGSDETRSEEHTSELQSHLNLV